MDVNDMAVIATKSVGIWGTGITLPGVFSGITALTAVVALIKAWPALRKIGVEGDMSLRRDLLLRIDTLERAAVISDQRCDARMAVMQRDYEARIETLTQQFDRRIDGLMKQLVTYQMATGRPMELSEESRAAGERALAHIEKREGERT